MSRLAYALCMIGLYVLLAIAAAAVFGVFLAAGFLFG